MKAFPILLLMIFITVVSSSENKNMLSSIPAPVREHYMNPMLSAKDMFIISQTSKNAYNMYHKLANKTHIKEYTVDHPTFKENVVSDDCTEVLEKQNLNFTITFPYNEYENDIKNYSIYSVFKQSIFRMRFHNTNGSAITAEMAFNYPKKLDGANLFYYESKRDLWNQTKCDDDGSFTIRIFPQDHRYIIERTRDNHKYSMDFEYQNITIFKVNPGGHILGQGIFNSLNFD